MLFSLLSKDLFAPGPIGENSANFDVEVFATTDPAPRPGDPLTPHTYFFHEALFGSSVDLTNDGNLTFDGLLNSSLFSPVSLSSGRASSSLLATQSFSTSFQLDVPAGVNQFRIVAYSQVTDTLQAQTPEPSTYLLLGCGLIAISVLSRRFGAHLRDSACMGGEAKAKSRLG